MARLLALTAALLAARNARAQVPGFQCGRDADCGLCVLGELCCCDAGCVANGDCCGSVEEYRQVCEAGGAPAPPPTPTPTQPPTPGGGSLGLTPEDIEQLANLDTNTLLSALCPPSGNCEDLPPDELFGVITTIEAILALRGGTGGGDSGLGGLLPGPTTPPAPGGGAGGGGDIGIGTPIDIVPPAPPPIPPGPELCRGGAAPVGSTFVPGLRQCGGCPPPFNWFRECPPTTDAAPPEGGPFPSSYDPATGAYQPAVNNYFTGPYAGDAFYTIPGLF